MRVREQYHHAIDIVPTVLDCLQIPQPDVVKGITQIPIQGVSMRYSFDAAVLPSETAHPVLLDARYQGDLSRRLESSHHPSGDQRLGAFGKDTWELYHSEIDRAEDSRRRRGEP